MTSTSIDYAKTYFEHPRLTKIHGEPSFDTLKPFRNEIKANLASVSSELGGGVHGHLGLGFRDEDYDNIAPGTPYVRPLHPGAAPEVGATQHDTIRMRDEWKDKIKLFREVTDVEKTIIKQIVEAIDEKYIKSIRDRVTNTIKISLIQILEFLFDRYGIVEDDDLREKEEQMRQFSYDISDPIVEIFNPIEDLEEFGVAANDPYTSQQLIKFGLQIIKDTGDLEKGQEEWHERPRNEKTWATFKEHFERAHRILRKTRGKTMKGTAFHRANMLAEQVLHEVRAVQTNVLEALDATNFDGEDKETVLPPQQKANSAATSVQDEILNTLRMMQGEIAALKRGNLCHQTSTEDTNTSRNNQRRPVDRTKYCWTHGAWNHLSKDCFKPREGHKKEATFANKMGGSTKKCQ